MFTKKMSMVRGKFFGENNVIINYVLFPPEYIKKEKIYGENKKIISLMLFSPVSPKDVNSWRKALW